MGTSMHKITLITLALLEVMGLAGTQQGRAEEISLDLAWSTPTMLAGKGQKNYLQISMTGFDPKKADKRPPVNIAFVLDKSGSMQGEKIEKVKQATRMALEKLRDDDIVSIVAYDSGVQALVPATRLTDRNQVYAAIERLKADQSTALFAGVSKGAAELHKFFDRARVNRIVLLSDGLANVGPSSPGDLGELGTSLGREGISVSTIGLGLDYNEDLMSKLAQKSDGNHMFAENATDIDLAFTREFGDVLTVVAQKVNVRIQCGEGVRPIRILGREGEIAGQTITLSLNQLYGNQTKYIILETEMPEESRASKEYAAAVKVSYLNMVSNTEVSVQRETTATFTDVAALAEGSVRKDVMAAVVQQIGVENNILAMKLRDEGKIEEARKLLFSNAHYLNDNAIKLQDKELEAYSSRNNSAISNLDDTKWQYQRKVMRAEQHELITQQGFSIIKKGKE